MFIWINLTVFVLIFYIVTFCLYIFKIFKKRLSCANNRVVSIIKAEFGNRKFPHYYGDISRIFFLFAGIIMLFGLPILNQTISVPAYISILFVLSVVFIAGITNPAQRMLSVLDLIVSLVGFIVFEYYSVKVFAEGSIYFIYLINQ